MTQTITVQELKQKMDSEQAVQLVDVRSAAEYLASRIEGAQLIASGDLDQASASLDKRKPVYVLCRSGNRATAFSEQIASLGFDARVVEGGLDQWLKQGYPAEQTAGVPWSIERQTRFGAGLFVFIGVALGVLVHPAFIYLAGFVGLGLMFAGLTNFCGMAMFLEKMPWNKKIVEPSVKKIAEPSS